MIKIRNLNKYYHKGKSNEIHVIDNTSVTEAWEMPGRRSQSLP